jgi:hypothetical protein
MPVMPAHHFSKEEAEAAFWAKVTIGRSGECWPWRACRDKDGYGWAWFGDKMRRAQQLAWELHYRKPFPSGMSGLHSCDTPPCCNPVHVWPGTQADNVADRDRKGRHRYGLPTKPQMDRGEACWNAKLRNVDVATMRRLVHEGWTQKRIAARFKVSRAHVSKILSGRLWKHLPA